MIPPRFFQAMSMEELKALLFERNGILNAQECQRLWHMCEYQGEPPQTLQVLFNKADILRILAPKKRST
jgi:hypothetical protein